MMQTIIRAVLAALIGGAVCSHAVADDVIDSPMYRSPELPLAPVVKTYPEGMAKLWLEALERPEVDYKCNAALAIAAAHEGGMKELRVAVAPLLRELDRPDVNPTVRLAAVRALLTLNARESAPRLLKLTATGDIHLCELIDPALARWKHDSAREIWLMRLDQPRKRTTVLAIQSLVAVREKKALAPLRRLLFLRDVAPAVRIESARALAITRPDGPECTEDAERLQGGASPQGISDRLAAAALLGRSKGEVAEKLLLSLAKDSEPAVAAIAVARLIQIDAKLVEPLLGSILTSIDAKVRGLGVTALALQPSDAHIQLLAERLSDPHPDVRSQARQVLRGFGGMASLREPVIREATRILANQDWRGLDE